MDAVTLDSGFLSNAATAALNLGSAVGETMGSNIGWPLLFAGAGLIIAMLIGLWYRAFSMGSLNFGAKRHYGDAAFKAPLDLGAMLTETEGKLSAERSRQIRAEASKLSSWPLLYNEGEMRGAIAESKRARSEDDLPLTAFDSMGEYERVKKMGKG